MGTAYICFKLLFIAVHWHGSQCYQESKIINEDHGSSLHPGRVILYRPSHAFQRPDFNNDRDAYRPTFQTSAPQVYSHRPNSHSYEDYKLPASKYTNDYFQPPRPLRVSKPVGGRASFAFPDGDNDWSPRTKQVASRQRFHSFPAVITSYGSSGDDRSNTRPTSLERDVTSGRVIVASGPGGVRHVIHDLRDTPHATEGEKTSTHRDPDRSFPQHRFSGGVDQPQGNAYKGIPVFLDGGTFGTKEYDPRFVKLYRQVLEENQKRTTPRQRVIIPVRPFNPSPTLDWFSEVDPLYHPRGRLVVTPSTDRPNLVAINRFSTTTDTTTIHDQSSLEQENFPDSINAQLPPPTAKENTRIPYTTAETQQPTIPTRETVPWEPIRETQTASSVLSTQVTSERLLATTATTENNVVAKVLQADVDRQEDLVGDISNLQTAIITSTLSTRPTSSQTESDVISTSVSKTISVKQDVPDSDELLGIKNRLAESTETSISSAAVEETTVQVEYTTPEGETTTALNEPTTTNPSFEETLTPSDGEVTMTTPETPTDVTDNSLATDYEQSASVLTESQTQPSNVVTEMALTTLNFLVMSLVNQARANTILSESTSTISPSQEETTIQNSTTQRLSIVR